MPEEPDKLEITPVEKANLSPRLVTEVKNFVAKHYLEVICEKYGEEAVKNLRLANYPRGLRHFYITTLTMPDGKKVDFIVHLAD